MSGIFIFLIVSISGVLCFREQDHVYKVECNTFAEVLQSPAFVDKTMMIPKLIKQSFDDTKVVLITAPRRFGKSINMDMVRRFFELQVFKNGTRIPKEQTYNYRLFTENNLRIHDPEHSSFFREYFGEFPVLFMDFKSLNGESFGKFLDSFRLMITELCRQNRFLLKTDCCETGVNMVNALIYLCKCLHTRFQRKVILLIDEFDSLIQHAIFKDGNDTELIIKFISDFTLGFFNDKENIEYAILNAYVTEVNYFVEGLNVFQFGEEHPFTIYYGLTDNEVINLIKKCNCESQMKSIRKWYGGYNVANSEIRLYNVLSIVNFMQSKIFENYWAQSDRFLNLQQICLRDDVYTKIMSVLIHNSTEIDYTNHMSVHEIVYLRNFILNPTNVELNANLLFSLMFKLGYFTTVKGYFEVHQSLVNKAITVPNLEIRSEIVSSLSSLQFLKLKFNVSETDEIKYMASLLKLGKERVCYEEFGKNARSLFKNLPMPLQNKFEFHSPLFTIPYFRQALYSLQVDQLKTLTKNYIGILIIRKNDHTGIITVVKHSGSHRGKSYKGLCQIVGEKRYYGVLDKYKVKNRIFVGIYLDVNGECSLSYLFNTTDISKAVNITC